MNPESLRSPQNQNQVKSKQEEYVDKLQMLAIDIKKLNDEIKNLGIENAGAQMKVLLALRKEEAMLLAEAREHAAGLDARYSQAKPVENIANRHVTVENGVWNGPGNGLDTFN